MRNHFSTSFRRLRPRAQHSSAGGAYGGLRPVVRSTQIPTDGEVLIQHAEMWVLHWINPCRHGKICLAESHGTRSLSESCTTAGHELSSDFGLFDNGLNKVGLGEWPFWQCHTGLTVTAEARRTREVR